jgi:hypothetical protein
VKINKRDDDFKDLKKSVVMLIDAYDKLDKSKEDQESKNQLNKIIQTIKENMKKI